MATISTLVKSGRTHQGPMRNTRLPYVVENYIDLADVASAKGSAIAQGDVIHAIHVPAGTLVLYAGLQLIEDMTGTSTDATIDFGVTGGNVDAFVDGWDLDGAAVGAFASPASTAITDTTFLASADTLDLLVATQTGSITGGVIRAFAVLVDLSNQPRQAGIVQLGS